MDAVKAVILVGSPDFGRCPLATRVNRALWPIAERPVLQRLVEHVSYQGVRRFVICHSYEEANLRESVTFPEHLDVQYWAETLPRGTAGCIRDAADPDQDELLFIFPAALISPPDLHELISEHRTKDGIMTIFFTPSGQRGVELARDAQIYVCEPEVMKYIPAQGYFDIKENLVPTLVQAGKIIAYAQLQHDAGNYRNWGEYVRMIKQHLLTLKQGDPLLKGFHRHDNNQEIWIGNNVRIDPSAKIIGPILIGDNTNIEHDACLLGPSMIESGVQIYPDTLISESVIWKEAVIGPYCRIQESLIDEKKVLSADTEANTQLIIHSSGWISRAFRVVANLFRGRKQFPSVREAAENSLFGYFSEPGGKNAALIVFLIVLGCLLAAYWNPTLIELWQTWMRSDEYSSGLLVPLLIVYIVWDRRKALLQYPIKPVPGAVFALFFVQTLRLVGLMIGSPSVEYLTLFLTIGVLIWILLGSQFMREIIPVWLYLVFMFPLPKTLEWKITVPLQKWASVSSVFCLETLGFQVIREGNIININGTLVAVAEACNGLRMLTAFFVVTGFVVLLSRRKLWEKCIILLSSVPIALLCNTIRLACTAIAFLYLDTEKWEKAFHDYGGIAMMPLAIGITLFELWFLSKLIIGSEAQAVKT